MTTPKSTRPLPLDQSYTVDPVSGCWRWNRAVNSDGYAIVKHDRRVRTAHRLIWELTNGPVPAGRELAHQCHNRCCVRPDHLLPVTHAENMTGSRKVLVTAELVAAIQALSGKMTKGRIAALYNVSHRTIDRVLRMDAGTVTL